MQYSIRVHYNGQSVMIYADSSLSLGELLTKHGFILDQPCAGHGTCGKCAVRAEGALTPKTDAEAKYLRSAAPEMRLACQAYPQGDVDVWLPRHSEAKIALGGEKRKLTVVPHVALEPKPALGVAIDIGTTTVAAALYDLENGVLLGELGQLNEQRTHGADVISRIQYCMENPEGIHVLRDQIVNQLNGMLAQLHKKKSQIRYISVAGNTAMLHFLCGVMPTGLAVAPYMPERFFGEELPAGELGIQCKNAMVLLSPAVAGFVGGDITADVLAIGLHRKRKFSLILDIGTNGEMVAGNHRGMLCCATAAGPAFEGACISCGMGAWTGAVNAVEWSADKLRVKTIDHGRPKGICGSGIIDLMSVLLRTGAVEETGRLLPPDEAPEPVRRYLQTTEQGIAFEFADNLYLTEQDVRQIQLARAAIRAGVETLLAEARKDVQEVETVYLAGGFGNYIRKESAAEIGLFPPALLPKVRSVGNTSAVGAARALLSRMEKHTLLRLPEKMRYIELSQTPGFTERYVDAMYF